MLTFNHGSPYFWHKVVLPKFISGCRMDLICGNPWLKRIYNPIAVFSQCLPFSWTEIRGKHCRHPINVMGVVDTFEHGFISQKVKKLQEAESLPFCPTVAAFLRRQQQFIAEVQVPPRVKYILLYPYNFQTEISITNHCV